MVIEGSDNAAEPLAEKRAQLDTVAERLRVPRAHREHPEDIPSHVSPSSSTPTAPVFQRESEGEKAISKKCSSFIKEKTQKRARTT